MTSDSCIALITIVCLIGSSSSHLNAGNSNRSGHADVPEELFARIIAGLGELWPDEGTIQYEVVESTDLKSVRAQVGIDTPQVVTQKLTSKKEIEICSEYAHIVSEQVRPDGTVISRSELLDQVDGRLSWGSSDATGVYLTKTLSSSYVDQLPTHRAASLIGGTIGSMQEPRLKAFLQRNRDKLELESTTGGTVSLSCIESNGAKWRFEFAGDAGRLFLTAVEQTDPPGQGVFKSHWHKSSDIKYAIDSCGRRHLAGYVNRSRTEYQNRSVLERSVESNCEVVRFEYLPSRDESSMRLRNEPKEGMKVKLVGSDWLHHEWRDGRVVAVTDPDAMKRLENFEFANEGIAWRKWVLIGGSVGLMAGAFWWYRRSSTAAAVLMAVLLGHGVSADESSGVEGTGKLTHAARQSTLARQDERTATDESEALMGWDEPYCGIVSAFAVMKHFGKSAEFRDLITVDYVGSSEGSTGLQIQSALKHHGIESAAFTRTNPSTLLACRGPVILHTRSRTSPLYRHWVAYLGRDGDALRILDPSLGMVTMSAAELQAQWDGLMIVPDASRPARTLFLAATFAEYLPAVGVGVSVIAGMAMWTRSRAAHAARGSYASRVLRQSAILAAAGVLLGVGFASLLPGGVYQSDAAVATIAGLHPGEFLTAAELAEVQLIAGGENSDAVLIDCRFESSFQRGSIPTAIPVPLDATAAFESGQLQGIEKDRTLVLFCQSENCGYDELVARRLIGRGYSDVRLFRGGYAEWQQAQKTPPVVSQSPVVP